MQQDPYQQPTPQQQQYQGYGPQNPYQQPTPAQPQHHNSYPYEYQQSRSQADPQPQQMYQKPLARQQSLDRRSLIGGIGAIMALLGFFLPYFATYSGHELASLYGMYWLDVIFVVAAFLLLAFRLFVPSLMPPRRLALLVIVVGAAGAFIHYLLVNLDSIPMYWGIGAWLYFLGMIIVAICGVSLLL